MVTKRAWTVGDQVVQAAQLVVVAMPTLTVKLATARLIFV
jgi:hypothetical protein